MMEHEEIIKRFREAHTELAHIEVTLKSIRLELDLAGQAFKKALECFDKAKSAKAPDETI